MLQNVEIHKKCFCYKDGKDAAVELIELQNGEIGTVNLFKTKIIFVTKGNVKIISENNNMSCMVKQWEFVFMPIGTRLSFKAFENSEMMFVKLGEDLPQCHNYSLKSISRNKLGEKYNGIYALKANERMLYFIKGFLATFNDGLKCNLYVKNEISRMLFLLHAYYPQEECIKFLSTIITPDVKFSEFVRLNHNKYKTMGELASAMCMSSQQFSRKFKKVFGVGPREWVQSQKAQSIYYEICQNDKPFKEIAMDHEFSMQSNFIRYCRTTFGSSPSDIRRGARG